MEILFANYAVTNECPGRVDCWSTVFRIFHRYACTEGSFWGGFWNWAECIILKSLRIGQWTVCTWLWSQIYIFQNDNDNNCKFVHIQCLQCFFQGRLNILIICAILCKCTNNILISFGIFHIEWIVSKTYTMYNCTYL